MIYHDRIWLEPEPASDPDYGRQWVQHNVWPDGVEYVRADLFHDLEATLAEYRDHSQPYWEARATAAEATVTALQEALERIARHGTVAGMHEQDRSDKLQDIARTAYTTIRRTTP